MEALTEEWDSLYEPGSACVCCGTFTCPKSDCYRRVTASGSDTTSSESDSADEWDYSLACCFPFIGVYE